jgi:hypothetical protein
MDRGSLLKFKEGRRDIIWALEGLAEHAELFLPAANLLLSLAEAENERWLNNATGVFAGLFSLAYGDGAPTGLAPEYRLTVLTTALKANERRARIALKAFGTSLSMHSVTCWGGDTPFRLKVPVARWTPKTYGELFDAIRLYWRALQDSLKSLAPNLQREGVEVLLSHTRELLAIVDLRAEIIETLKEISELPEIDRRQIISTLEMVLSYDREGLSGEVVSQLISLRDEMVGASFHSRLQRYAGMDLLEDQMDQHGRESNQIQADLQKLAEEALAIPDQLRSELKWLVTAEARNGYRFGHQLAQLDSEQRAWRDIKAAYYETRDSANDYFIGGYLRAVFERDPGFWERIIFDIANEGPKPEFLPGLIWRSGMTENVGRLILQFAQDRKIAPESLGVFSVGRASDGLPDAIFVEWLNFLIGVGSFAASSTALNLAAMALMGGRKLTADQLTRLLTQPELFKQDQHRPNVMLSHYWLQLSRALIELDRDSQGIVLRCLIDSIANAGVVAASLGPEGDRYLDQLVARNPAEAWRIVSEYIKPPMDTRGFVVTRWLRGDTGFSGRNPGPICHIPRDEIWAWIEEDPEARAPYIATMAPKDFTIEAWHNGLIREILCRFGHSDKVQSAVFANFFTGSWTGPASAHFDAGRDVLLQLKSGETHPNALRWLNDAIKSTESHLESAKIEEEARGF